MYNNNAGTNAGFHYPYPYPYPTLPLPPISDSGTDDDEFPPRDGRFPQWNNQETRDFIEIRAQLEWEFATVKRNKNLWEMVVNRMREKGYRRTVDQCKCKWKNLVTRYKGSDFDNRQQFPFFDELHAVFEARAATVQQAQIDSENTSTKGKRHKTFSENQLHEEISVEPDDDDEEDETEVDQSQKGRIPPIKKNGREKRQKTNNMAPSQTNVNNNTSILAMLPEMLSNFLQQQQMIDLQLKEAMEKREQEREIFEQEWRQTMEKLERERLAMEEAWREREEQRRLREESRAERRDALLTALLNKLIHDENH